MLNYQKNIKEEFIKCYKDFDYWKNNYCIIKKNNMILWPSRIRRRFDILDINKIEEYLLENGYKLQFEGGLTKDENSDDSWFKYLHYYNKDKQFKIRICYF